MKVCLFDYHLPPGLIAQEPLPRRDDSRLLVVNRRSGAFTHHYFREFPDVIDGEFFMVVNNARVIPARILGSRLTGGKAEVLLVRESEEDVWVCMVKPGRRLRRGKKILFSGGKWCGEIMDVLSTGERVIRFSGPGGAKGLWETVGRMPLPPYIRRSPNPDDQKRYQTIFAARMGAVAAPTAGLHFTPQILNSLKAKGIQVSSITLHVGPGTFRPVKAEEVEEHRMEMEYYDIPPQAARCIQEARQSGKRLLAVGTTVTRALESSVGDEGGCTRLSGWTDLFIYPGYRFKIVDALLTNFHLPRSSLLMLVCAFGGRELILKAYEEAIKNGYRFYSYGDAMLIL